MCCRDDGFGSQYLSLISVYVFSMLTNRTYCATPFHVVPHFTAIGDAVHLDAGQLFSFIGGMRYGPLARPETPRKYTAVDDVAQLAPDLRAYHRAAPQVRAWYDASSSQHRKPWQLRYRPVDFNIALHIRRGDVAPGGAVPKPHLVTSDMDIAACVETVMRMIAPSSSSSSRAIALHVFSQGESSDFAYLGRWRPKLHIEQRANLSSRGQTKAVASIFHHMVSADALIIAKSSLSVVAGYLSSGRVFTPERTRAPSVIGRLERCT